MKTTIAAVILLALAFAVPAPARAAEPGPGPSSYTLTLTANDVAYLAAVLRERPYKEVAAILTALQAQVDAQRDASAKPKD